MNQFSMFERQLDWKNPDLVALPFQENDGVYDEKIIREWKAKRSLSLLESIAIYDPLDGEFGSYGENSQPFRASTLSFMQSARSARPTKRGNTVSDFADWIYSIYIKYKDENSLKRGKIDERDILKMRSYSLPESITTAYSWGWTLVYDGISKTDLQYSLPISTLCINGMPLRASPDLIFQSKSSNPDGPNKTIIIEIKSTRADIPSNLWPNVWAQLWAYSKIDYLQHCREISVVGEIWGREQNIMLLRKSVHRNAREKNFDDFFSTLFNIYSDSRTTEK